MDRGVGTALAGGAAAVALGCLAPPAYAADHGHPGGDKGSGSGAAAHGSAHRADPGGNNGTIKIDDLPADSQRSNRPHPGCDFALKFFDFDMNQHADITFTGQAPTAFGTLRTYKDRLISTTPVDGAMEAGHTLVLSAADLGLVGRPQAKQGWHVKVSVNAIEAPGGAKHKVFWLRCPAPAAPTTRGTGSGSGTTSGTGSSTSGTSTSSTSTSTSSTSSTGSGSSTVSTTGSRTAAGGKTAAAATAPQTLGAATVHLTPAQGVATTGSSSTAGRGSGLPFTGLPLAMLVGAAGAASALGAVALRAGRRPRLTR